MTTLTATLALACGPSPSEHDAGLVGRDGDTGPAVDAALDAGSRDAASPDAATPPDGGPPTRPLELDDFSRVARPALDSLLDEAPDERGRAWDYFGDIDFDPGWILQTPSDHWGRSLSSLSVPDECPASRGDCDPDFGRQTCATQADCTGGGTCRPFAATVTRPDESPRSLCLGHSDHFVEVLYEAVVGARETADVTSLSPPDGRFEAAYRNALTYLSHDGRPVRVRLLFGNILGSAVDTGAVLTSLTRDLAADTPMTISVGAYRVGTSSWNHSKIVAIDGELLIEGGHNYYTEHYLESSPVHDLSVRARGPAAIVAARFANPMWDYVCEGHTFSGYTGLSTFPASAPECPEPYDTAVPSPVTGGARTIVLARYGGLGANPSDAALVAMLEAAEHTVNLSLQDLGPLRVAGVSVGDWPQEVLGAFGRAMARGVDVRLVLSNPGSTPGGLTGGSNTYSNGWTPEDAVGAMQAWLEDNPGVLPSGETARSLVCERFHVTTLRASDEDTWPNGATLGNHSKFFIVDDLAFYVGSQNLYDANLAELGLIVDDPVLTQQIRDAYWAPMWEQSARVAVSGSDAGGCSF